MLSWQGMQKYCSILIGLIIVSACTVGPDWQRPLPPDVKEYINSESGNGVHYVSTTTIPAQWWQLFNSPQINELISEALKNNQNLTSMRATLRQAQANYKAVAGAELPQVSANAGATVTRFSPSVYGFNANLPTTDFVLYNIAADVSYNLDIFGGLRRQSEASAAYAQYQFYELRAAELTLTANIITAVFKLAMLNDQIATYRESIKAQESILSIARHQLSVGGIASYSVNNLEKNLLQTKSDLPGLIKTQQLMQHQLAVYLGVAPPQVKVANYRLSDFALMKEVPLAVPAKLVYQRPDILAAEALFHQASAQVGVATANLYPSFSISGSGGPIASQQNWTSFSGQAWIWNVGPSVNVPIFSGGTLRAQRKAAQEAFYAAQANYKQTVLQGLQNVDDCLSVLNQDAKILDIQNENYTKSKDNLEISQNQFKAGGISYSQLQNEQVLANQALISLLQAKSAIFADTAALIQALGGGWWAE